MSVDTTAPRSRRAILAASLGGAAAFVANALSRATPAEAANGQTVTVGGNFSGTTATRIGTTGDHGFWGSSPDHVGVVGTSIDSWGVDGESTNGWGVSGYSAVEIGVRGESAGSLHGVAGVSAGGNGVFGTGPGAGVYGDTAGGIGVVGASNSGFGVRGSSNAAAGVVGASPYASLGNVPVNTGVYGVSKVDGSSRGVVGETTSGRGVNGIAQSGRGVQGQATSGRGVYGYASTGTAGYFERQAGQSGTALRAVGPVKFDNCSGLATITAGTNAVTVTPGIDLATTSAVVATLQGDAGGATAVKRVAVNATNNTFVIVLTANSTATVKVAWHVFV
jgi:hypothetical protein